MTSLQKPSKPKNTKKTTLTYPSALKVENGLLTDIYKHLKS